MCVGTILTASSFAGFFLNDGGSDGAVSSLGFVYGIPVFLIGLSLWYAEIKPVQVTIFFQCMYVCIYTDFTISCMKEVIYTDKYTFKPAM
jgi:hypothetical protein